MSHTASVIPDWARAHGEPIVSACSRAVPSDFQVTEVLGFEPSGSGEHDLLWVEKIGTNTAWLARELARFAGVQGRDVGYSGLKDRNALTTQWFSVRRPTRDGTDWSSLAIDDVRILRETQNTKKLRRGVHAANRFRINLRGDAIDRRAGELENRIDTIRRQGLPNYFGAQRFGHEGGNLDLARALFAGRRLKRDRHSIALSAARSFLFNEMLDSRVRDGSWNRLQIGDRANLNGTGSVFSVDALTAELERRCAEFDIHPSATLWGRAAPLSSSRVAKLESDVAAAHVDLSDGLVRSGVDAASRPLRVVPADLHMSLAQNTVCLSFTLPRGSYATTVLREIAEV